jgi:hypothetical protein
MAVIPYRNRNVTPQDVVQDLAADILHADIQPREYSRYVGQLNTHDAARESPKDAYKRVSPYSTKDSIATSSDSDDSKKFSNTRAQTRSGQKARKYSSPIRYYLPSDQDVVDSRPNKSGFGCSLPKNMHSENPYEPWLHQRSDEKGGDEDNVPQWEKDEMKAFTVRAPKAQRTFDEYDHYKYQRPTPTVLAEPEVFHNEREATTQFRKPPNIHRATYDDYEEAKAASDDQRQDWEDNRNTPRGRSDFQGVGVHVSPIPSCPRDSCLSYIDIKTWQMDVCKSIDPIEPEVFREHSSSYNEDLARYGVTSVWSNGKAGTEVESPSKVGAESTTRQNEQRNSWSFSWEALFGEEKSPKMPSPRHNLDQSSRTESRASALKGNWDADSAPEAPRGPVTIPRHKSGIRLHVTSDARKVLSKQGSLAEPVIVDETKAEILSSMKLILNDIRRRHSSVKSRIRGP